MKTKLTEERIYSIIKYAINAHDNVNQTYDNKPYSIHLYAVAAYVTKYKKLIKGDYDKVFCAAFTHDLIEDARETYNDVKFNSNHTIAELTYALTNEKGKTRDDRANDKYYAEMKLVEDAVFLKICDRLANMKYSIDTQSSMARKYAKEYENFKSKIYDPAYDSMFNELEKMCDEIKKG